MARVKLSEHDAKRLLFPVFGLDYQGISFTDNPDLVGAGLAPAHLYPAVLKVDQGVKKRGKQGLIAVNVGATLPAQAGLAVAHVKKWRKKGYTQFLLEPMIKHDEAQEKYLSFERTRDGWLILQSDQGGIEIESSWDSVHQVNSDKYQSLTARLDSLHISFLEINPYIVQDKQLIPLDMAVEIDSTAIALAELASDSKIIPVQDHNLTTAESRINKLDASTPAALKFRFLNQEGRIWMLLSGGGASLVLADEVADIGLGDQLANYGEYSGAPSTDDTYAYTKIILSEILKTKHSKSTLIIAGGVANFTDVAKTFTGIIRALDEVKGKLAKLGVRVFVRRGGPNEEAGLKLMRDFLDSADLLGSVHGHTSPLTQVVTEVSNYLQPVGATLAVARPHIGKQS